VQRLSVTAAGAALAGRAVETVETVGHDYFAGIPDRSGLVHALLVALAPPPDMPS
jgi:hypothetical protein